MRSVEKTPLPLSYFNVPPFIIYDYAQDKLIGGAIYVFLERHIQPEMGVEFVWDRSPTTIPRQLTSINSGATDALALLSYTPQRAEKLAFTATPFFIASPGIAILKSNPLNNVDKIEDLLHLRIGYGLNIYISPLMKDKRIHFDLLANENYNVLNFKKMMASRIDAVYTPDLASILAVIKTLKLENEVKVLKLPDKASAFHVVFSNDMKEVARRYDNAFEKIHGGDAFMKILSGYIDISELR